MPPLGAGKSYKSGGQNKKDMYGNSGAEFGEFRDSLQAYEYYERADN